jgi:hypothetical protein
VCPEQDLGPCWVVFAFAACASAGPGKQSNLGGGRTGVAVQDAVELRVCGHQPCLVVSQADGACLWARECGGDGNSVELHADAGQEPDLAGAKGKAQAKSPIKPGCRRLFCRQCLALSGKTAPDQRHPKPH